jgi:hypothetical protein
LSERGGDGRSLEGSLEVDDIPFRNTFSRAVWQLETTTQWQKDQKWYARKHPAELAAVLRNLDRFLEHLKIAPNSKAVQAGYLHPEPAGVVAIDQKGGGANLQETRLYLYADDRAQIVYLITIGNKDTQAGDIALAREFAESLQNPPP